MLKSLNSAHISLSSKRILIAKILSTTSYLIFIDEQGVAKLVNKDYSHIFEYVIKLYPYNRQLSLNLQQE